MGNDWNGECGMNSLAIPNSAFAHSALLTATFTPSVPHRHQNVVQRMRAGGDPVREDLVFERIDFKAFAAFVRDGGRGFKKEQAATGIGGINAAALRLAGEGNVIAFIIVTAERKAETILAGGSAVTGAGVAAGLCENRLDMVAESEFFGGRRRD